MSLTRKTTILFGSKICQLKSRPTWESNRNALKVALNTDLSRIIIEVLLYDPLVSIIN